MRYRSLYNQRIYDYDHYVLCNEWCKYTPLRVGSIVSPPEKFFDNFIKENHYRYYENRITDVLWCLAHHKFDDSTFATIICDNIKLKTFKDLTIDWIVKPGSELNGIKFNYAYGVADSKYGPCKSRIIVTEQFTHNKYGFETFRFNYPMPILMIG